jgi:hypothetical protein
MRESAFLSASQAKIQLPEVVRIAICNSEKVRRQMERYCEASVYMGQLSVMVGREEVSEEKATILM